MKLLDVKTRDTELELIYCPKCLEMGNHLNGICQGCQTNNQAQDNCCIDCGEEVMSIMNHLSLSEKDYKDYFKDNGVHIPKYRGYICVKCGENYDQYFRRTDKNKFLVDTLKINR